MKGDEWKMKDREGNPVETGNQVKLFDKEGKVVMDDGVPIIAVIKSIKGDEATVSYFCGVHKEAPAGPENILLVQEIERENLVFLVFVPNTTTLGIQEEIPEGVELDLIEGTWTFEETSYEIGKHRPLYHQYWPEGHPYGVYDRSNFAHLKTLVYDYENWHRRK